MRGGSRGKTSNIGFKQNSDPKIPDLGINSSIFNDLQKGCFEKDYLSFCSNRLSDFSCVYWLRKETMNLEELFPRLKANISGNSSLEIRISKKSLDCLAERIINKENMIYMVQLAIPFVIILPLLLNILICLSMRRLGHTFLPLCIYFCYLAVFDSLDLIIRGGDIFLEYFFRIRFITAVQLLQGSSCQMFTMAFSILKHLQAALYIGLAVDTWRFVMQPTRMFSCYRKEWIRNVLILAAAVLVTVNCQYFWTFSMNKAENKIIHGRLARETYECGFSSSPNKYYVSYVWPAIELMAGEILPLFFCIIFGCLSLFHLKRNQPDFEHLSRFLINSEFVLAVQKTFTGILLLYALFSLPRVVYILIKYSLFSHNSQKHSTLVLEPGNNISTKSLHPKESWVAYLTNSEPKIEKIELTVKLIDLMFVNIKFLALFIPLKQFRDSCLYFLTCKCCRSQKRSLKKYPNEPNSPKKPLV